MSATAISGRALCCSLAAAVGLLLGGQRALAATYNLKTGLKGLTMPDGTVVQMWGFGLADQAEVTVPGPQLEVPPGDTTLTIHLTNTLPVPVSIVIPALPAPLTPQWNDGGTGARTSLAQRVYSFTRVAAAHGGTATYEWTNVPPGTYLYHSGTHPAVQVQMGLYGAVKRDQAAGTAYPGVGYDKELLLLYSEVDPALHAAVAAGQYGTPAYPSPVEYRPRYFLVNGEPAADPPPLAAGNVNQRVLIRFLNAGLKTVMPALGGGSYLSLLAEDGHPYPHRAERYALLLPAGKTRDALFAPTAEGTVTLFDRSLRMSDRPGGATTVLKLQVGSPPGAPLAEDDSYTLEEDGSLDTLAAGQPGILANDTGALSAVLVGNVQAGTLELRPDGSFVYTPRRDFAGTDFFTYRASNGPQLSNLVTVELKVSAVNDAPMAMADAYQTKPGTTLKVTAPGVLMNDHDPEGDVLGAELVSGPAGGALTLEASGAFQYTPAAGTTTDSFTYRVFDGALYSPPATVTITVAENGNATPVATADFATTARNTAVVIQVLANDSDSDGTLDSASLALVDGPTQGGAAVKNADGTFTYTPRWNFLGTETFTYTVADNQGAVSLPATVQINVVAP